MKPPKLRESTLEAIEYAIIEATGNGEAAAYTVQYLRWASNLPEELEGPPKHDVPGLIAMAAETTGLRSELRGLDKKLVELRTKYEQLAEEQNSDAHSL